MPQVFLYGLFMDVQQLKQMGLQPRVVGQAHLDDHDIRILDRATLVPEKNSRAYGLLVSLSSDEVETLYSSAGVADYVAESVEVNLLQDGSVESATVYNLPPGRRGNGVNQSYAGDLARLARDLELPESYVLSIEEQKRV